ncbi:MAG: DUF2256 domain-containing protein [Nitrincola sp.]|nr:DUF2256 domain-containing protein [Nitrincola sp.]
MVLAKFSGCQSRRSSTLEKSGRHRCIKKCHLPEKICVCCHRPFSWRKKWKDNWDEVKYCSQRCQRQRARSAESANRDSH